MAHKKKVEINPPAQVALCYIRQSYTRDSDDTNSPERQHANIESLVKTRGWIAEWYEDVGGHKSGRSEENRPGWLALKDRLEDPDVVALVANDMSRLHRKGWRIGRLLETLEEKNVALIFAAQGRSHMDTSTVQGRMQAQIMALVDEVYAEDIAQRAKDSILYRKSKGITVGIPPFGTVRDEEGHLIPSEDGAWYMPDGKFQKGKPTNPPDALAIWRPFYASVKYVLELYSQGTMGYEKIAYQLTTEGWPYRNRQGQPIPMDKDVVRRIVSNWPEYGGIVSERRAKDRPGYADLDLENIPFVEKNAVFPIDLLRAVAQVRHQRSVRTLDNGLHPRAIPYPLSVVTYCACCERKAQEWKNPKLRSRLHGYRGPDEIRRYRHKSGVKCGTHTRTVHCDSLHEDLGRLIGLLDVDNKKVKLMTKMALEIDKTLGLEESRMDLETKKRQIIALNRKRIDAAVLLFADGRLETEDYRRRVDTAEREIAYWQSQTTEVEKIQIELKSSLEIIQQMATLWERSNPKEKKGMAENLFEYIVYDLDTEQIAEFRLKPWADRFLVLRANLYGGDDPGKENIALKSLQDDIDGVPLITYISNLKIYPLRNVA